EELHTVNSELQAKVDELLRTGNDMANLLNSTEIATLFLDGALNVRRFTPQAARIMRLLPGDVDRPITDITSDLAYPAMIEDVHEVLRTFAARDREVATNDGRWFATRVMPYRTIANVIDGVVITFADITASRTTAAKLGVKHASLEKRFTQQTADLVKSRSGAPAPAAARDRKKNRGGKSKS
ncbi:MAG: PAS domain-containing protein, partial [Opitutaceae bacterium]